MSISFLDLGAMHAELRPELDLVWQRVVDGSAFIGGEAVDRFEAEWAAYCGTRHCVGLSDGTAALELALAALGLGPGDEVIVPANTFIATVEAVAAVGAVPVMIDVDPATLLMTGEAVRAACTSRTAAVIAVHLYDQPVDMDAIRAVAGPAGIAVIEDAAQAHGAT
jgi:dTDP-4-amino-4,6-dideoxygalactose transaminase